MFLASKFGNSHLISLNCFRLTYTLSTSNKPKNASNKPKIDDDEKMCANFIRKILKVFAEEIVFFLALNDICALWLLIVANDAKLFYVLKDNENTSSSKFRNISLATEPDKMLWPTNTDVCFAASLINRYRRNVEQSNFSFLELVELYCNTRRLASWQTSCLK